MKKGRPWTADEIKTLQDMVGRPTRAICEKLGRTMKSVQMKRIELHGGSTARDRTVARKIRAERRTDKTIKQDTRAVIGSREYKASRPPEELFADRDRRLLSPRTITAAFFGDPEQGRSALDQKRAAGLI